jgi:DMSO reductase family type II enzyme heme b subunit
MVCKHSTPSRRKTVAMQNDEENALKSHRVADTRDFLTPGARAWSQLVEEDVALMPTPLALQPTEYIRRSWETRTYGATKSLRAASVHDGHTWLVRVSWPGVSPAGTDFPDALAIALPVRGDPALATMGDPDAPVHFLRWSANKPGVSSILATGIGQSRPGPKIRSAEQHVAAKDTWHVVIGRALGSGKEVAPLQAGKKTRIGFAVWRGGNDERGGIKAFSIDWTGLVLDA